MRKKILIFLSAVFIAVSLLGCAVARYIPVPKRTKKPTGVYHKVKKGETVFRIAKAYDVKMDQIVEANRLSNADKIEADQFLFIPDRTRLQEILPPEGYEEDFVWPLKGRVISYYGATKVKIKNKQIKNKGIDIRAKRGAIIVAAKSGRATFVGEGIIRYGKMIIIDHGGGYQTVYTHNSENLISEGDFVKIDIPIAKVGTSGRTRVPKLHFEIRKNHKPCNPLHYLP